MTLTPQQAQGRYGRAVPPEMFVEMEKRRLGKGDKLCLILLWSHVNEAGLVHLTGRQMAHLLGSGRRVIYSHLKIIRETGFAVRSNAQRLRHRPLYLFDHTGKPVSAGDYTPSIAAIQAGCRRAYARPRPIPANQLLLPALAHAHVSLSLPA